MKMRVGVIGAGIIGLVAAYELAKAGAHVVLYEKEPSLGGHAKTVHFNGLGLDFDLNFMVFNQNSHRPLEDLVGDDKNFLLMFTRFGFIGRVSYPNMMNLFEEIDVDMEASDMSFSVSLKSNEGCEWGIKNGLSSLFAQKSNVVNPYFGKMLKEKKQFKDDVIKYLKEFEKNPEIRCTETLGHFIKSRGYSELFQKAYLVPMCASIWSCPSEIVINFSAFSVLSFCRNHHLLQLFGRPQWLTVKGRSHCFVNKIKEELQQRGCQIKTNCEVHFVSAADQGCIVHNGGSSHDSFDGCIIATHAPEALKLLGSQATYDEKRILGAFQYVYSDIFLHHDKSFMPRNTSAWSAWNFLGSMDGKVCLTYWLNVLQNIDHSDHPFLVTLNPPHTPENMLLKWSIGRPVPSVVASKASLEFDNIQGQRGIWFCGAYRGYGFHEDGLKAAMTAAHGILGRTFTILTNPRQMVPSLTQAAARLLVTRFLRRFISTGYFLLLEEGGTILTFKGTRKNCTLKSAVRVHSPQFYWKVATQAGLGLADAYISGDISLVDKNEGLINLFMIFIANKNMKSSTSVPKKRGWWTPMFLTAGTASAMYSYKNATRKNILTQARRNVSRHYDLSNEMFSLFLNETMAYSCAVFKSENEDLKIAQLRKFSLLIQKAKVEKNHELLQIGCGWGGLAVEVVKQTGCKYTGITLSKEQLKFAEQKVKEAGLQDRIKFLLCDYRQLPDSHKYDRIISCEMIEAVGHEYMEELFQRCESVLADHGLLVLQFISCPDERYVEFRRSSDNFLKEYIFPGGCLPCLSRVTLAMAAASRLCVEHLENIGIHYYQTLRYWRKNFMEHKSDIIALGFDEKFIRTWEYYFEYSAVEFKTLMFEQSSSKH